MADLFNSGNDPLAVLGQDTSSQRSQLAQYSILRAAAYLQDNKNDEALKSFKQALAFDPQNSTAQTYIAKIYLAKGDNFEAIKAFKTIVQAQPTSVDAHVNLANAYIQAKQYSDSEKELKAAARLDPTNPLPDYTLGLQYSNTDRLNEAVAQFNKVQKISPNDGNVFYALGMVQNKQGNFEDAAANLQKALTIKKSFPDANYELGVALDALGRTEEAQKQLTILQTAGSSLAEDLRFILEKPKIEYMDQNANRNFNQLLGPGKPLWMLDPLLLNPNATSQISVAIQFNNDMDMTSVMNPSNWEISRANSTDAGYYISQAGGLEVAIPSVPTFVSYNPETRQASVTFTIQQNAAGNATIDASHLVFKFSGTDAMGRQMDTTGDQIDGAALKAF